MSLVASNLYINWSDGTFTPSGGTALPVDKVTSVKPSRTADVERFKGGLAVFYQLIATPTQTRQIEITTGDVAAAVALGVGTVGTFSIKLADAVNGTAALGGGLLLTLGDGTTTYAKVVSNTAQGDHAKFAEATITLEGFCPTGTVDPLIVATL